MRLANDVVDAVRSSGGNVPETGDVGELLGGERYGDAPRRPMIDGSRWWSCGIALNKWVMSRAPLRTALVAMSVVAILYTRSANKPLSRTKTGEDEPVADRPGNTPLDDLLHAFGHSSNLRSRGDDTNTNTVGIRRVQKPVLLDSKVLCSVDLLDRVDAVFGLKKELRSMGTTLGKLDEGALRMPAEDCSRVRGRVRAEEVEEGGVEGLFLCLNTTA